MRRTRMVSTAIWLAAPLLASIAQPAGPEPFRLEDAAGVLGVSTDTIGRDWNAAKAWLLRELTRA